MSNIIFGPIHSRRFGKSLGIDLSPSKKQCNFDCLYCELDPADTVDSYEDIVSVDDVISALQSAMLKHSAVDFITLTANGEPTLYPYLSELIDKIEAIKGETQTLILSNGSTISDDSVVDALLKLDVVKLSLDCATDRCIHRLDRSHKGITIGSIMDGMLRFKAIYKKPLIIETLFVKGINDKSIEIEKLNEFLLKLQPTRIDIGTIDRPPAYRVEPLTYSELLEISQMFDSSLPIYISSRKKVDSSPQSYSKDEILHTLKKRPLSDDDIDILFDRESKNRLKELILDKNINILSTGGINFYLFAKNP
ncbi:Putative Fe-S oxidoreductase [hydrothermal vent metagenome]|uniref:Putative Fe-S oxidoreductase n=1 Tax=hydrothermal vent metagenome TaxID=652676 RepID=A0A1W1BHV0_9ZZZZ